MKISGHDIVSHSQDVFPGQWSGHRHVTHYGSAVDTRMCTVCTACKVYKPLLTDTNPRRFVLEV